MHEHGEPGTVDGAGGLDKLFGPGYRLVNFDPNAEEPRVGGDGGGVVEVAVVSGPPSGLLESGRRAAVKRAHTAVIGTVLRFTAYMVLSPSSVTYSVLPKTATVRLPPLGFWSVVNEPMT